MPLGLQSPVPNAEKKAAVDWPRRRQRDQRGTSTLEFIVVLPLLLIVWFGIVELSRAWHTLNIVTTAAREGARVGTVTPLDGNGLFDPSAAQDRIDGILAAANLVRSSAWSTATVNTANAVTCVPPVVTPPETDCVPDSRVRVDVTVTFETAVPLVLPILQELTIQQTASMRYE